MIVAGLEIVLKVNCSCECTKGGIDMILFEKGILIFSREKKYLKFNIIIGIIQDKISVLKNIGGVGFSG